MLSSVPFSLLGVSICDPMDCSKPGLPVHHELLEFTQTHVHWVGDNHLTISLSVAPFSSHLQSFPASWWLFSDESVLFIRWLKYWSFSFIIRPSNEYSGLISFRIDWLDLLAVQGTFKSLLQHHSSKASILCCSSFFILQLSHPYMTTGKTIALTRWTFVGKVIFLFFNMLSRLVITFLARSKHLLISWLQSLSAAILEPPKNKVSHCFNCFPIYLLWSGGTRYHDLRFLIVEFEALRKSPLWLQAKWRQAIAGQEEQKVSFSWTYVLSS